MKYHLKDKSLEETKEVVNVILTLLNAHKIVLFDGIMGSGKTTLIKHLCAALGVTEQVNSPTYSIVNVYKTHKNEVIYHFDFYRINSLEEAFDIGAEEYFYSGNICFIEWADKVLEILPKNYLKVSIEYCNERRNYVIEQY